MCEELSSFNKFDRNSSSRNMNNENLGNISCQSTVLLDITQSKGHCFDKGMQAIKKKSKFKFVDSSCSTSRTRKTLLRAPSIQKSCKISEAKATETNAASDQNLSENICFKKERKCKNVLRKRKQKLNFIDLQQNCSTPIRARGRPPGKKKTEKVIKKQNRKSKKESVCINKQEKSYSIPTDLTISSECRVLSPLKEIESTESSEGSIDFTSNEIFSKFNYESYYNNNLDCFTWDDSDETHNFLITTSNNNNNHEKENDINDNEFETYNKTEDCCLMKSNQKEGNILVIKSSTFSEYLSENDSLPGNKKSISDSCSSKSCCDYCCNDYALNLVTDNVNKSGLLEDAFNENLPDVLDTSHLCNTKSNSYLTDEFLNECNNSFLQDLDDFDSSLTDFISYSNEKTIEMEIFNQSAQDKKEDNNNVLNNSDYEADFDGISLISDKEWEDLLNMDLSEDSTKKKDFQCLLCPLRFRYPRTMAVHKASAHGGRYVMLCDICGRLFNRKHLFNRHLLYCGEKGHYQCDLCIKKYRHKSSLFHHLRVVHKLRTNHNASEKFTCSVCKKVYVRYGAFENHTKEHEKLKEAPKTHKNAHKKRTKAHEKHW